MSSKNSVLTVKDIDVKLSVINQNDYICITDMARFKSQDRTEIVIQNWIKNRNTVEFLGLWEALHNPDFKHIEFDVFKKEVGLNSFVLTPQKWIKTTNAKGLQSKSGRYGGTYAHKDIAFEFGSWLSSEFKLFLIKEFQRLKEEEAYRLEQGWDIERYLAKVNYRIHTDAVKENLIPPDISKSKRNYIYASEADLMNIAVFGITAAEWREKNPKISGNMRDHAYLEQLIVLKNIEAINAMLIAENMSQEERLYKLNKEAIKQLKSLVAMKPNRKLTGPEPC